jgi:hypothetical protein
MKSLRLHLTIYPSNREYYLHDRPVVQLLMMTVALLAEVTMRLMRQQLALQSQSLNMQVFLDILSCFLEHLLLFLGDCSCYEVKKSAGVRHQLALPPQSLNMQVFLDHLSCFLEHCLLLML